MQNYSFFRIATNFGAKKMRFSIFYLIFTVMERRSDEALEVPAIS